MKRKLSQFYVHCNFHRANKRHKIMLPSLHRTHDELCGITGEPTAERTENPAHETNADTSADEIHTDTSAHETSADTCADKTHTDTAAHETSADTSADKTSTDTSGHQLTFRQLFTKLGVELPPHLTERALDHKFLRTPDLMLKRSADRGRHRNLCECVVG